MTTDPAVFRPAPAPAPLGRLVRSEALMEARLLVRNGEQLLLSLAIPVGVLLVGRFFAGSLISFAELAPAVMALALWSSGFTAVAVATGFERRYGVLERLATTPLGRRGLVLGKIGGVALVAAGQLVVLGGLAIGLGWRPAGGALATAVAAATSLAAMAAFVSLALVMAGRLRAEATLALANLVHLVLAAAGGIVVPPDRLPPWLGVVVSLLPTGALGNAWRQLSVGPAELAVASGGWPLVVALVWAGISALVAGKVFRWLS